MLSEKMSLNLVEVFEGSIWLRLKLIKSSTKQILSLKKIYKL